MLCVSVLTIVVCLNVVRIHRIDTTTGSITQYQRIENTQMLCVSVLTLVVCLNIRSYKYHVLFNHRIQVYWKYTDVVPHEKLLDIRRVSNPSTSIDPGSLKIGLVVLI